MQKLCSVADRSSRIEASFFPMKESERGNLLPSWFAKYFGVVVRNEGEAPTEQRSVAESNYSGNVTPADLLTQLGHKTEAAGSIIQ